MAIWSHVEGAESDPPFGWMRHLIFKIQRENEPSARGWWRWWKPKRTRLLGRQEESCPSFSPARRDASPRDGRAALLAAERPREWTDPLASAPQPKQPLILMQNVEGGRE